MLGSRAHQGFKTGKTRCAQIAAVLVSTTGLAALDAVVNGGHGAADSAAAAGALADAAASSLASPEGAAAAAIPALTGPFGIETIGSHCGAGAIPSSLPWPQWPPGLSSTAQLQPLLQPAATIALLVRAAGQGQAFSLYFTYSYL